MWLLTNGHTEAIRALIAAHANIEALDDDQSTPLHLAALNGHTEAIKALLEAHANIEALDNNQDTPLHLAALNGHAEAIRALLDADVNIEATRQSSGYSITSGCFKWTCRSNQSTY